MTHIENGQGEPQIGPLPHLPANWRFQGRRMVMARAPRKFMAPRPGYWWVVEAHEAVRDTYDVLIRPEMVEAGKQCLRESRYEQTWDELVVKIYKAMDAHRR